MKNDKSKQVNKNSTVLVRIDAGLHYLLKIRAAESGRTIRELVEEGLTDVLALDKVSLGRKEHHDPPGRASD